MPAPVTVVICTHDRPELLRRCLLALQRVESPPFSILIVDSAPSSSETRELVETHGAKYILSSTLGLSRARNVGARAADSELIAFIDDDMEPHPLWLQRLCEGFDDKRVGVVTGPDVTLAARDAGHDRLQDLLACSPWGARGFQVDRNSPRWFERVNFGGVGDGNFALRRAAFDQLGGFDERLGRGAVLPGGEEHYLYFQLLSLGYAVVYQPEAVVFHPTVPDDHETARRLAEEAIAYAAFLCWNQPQYLMRVVAYLAGGVFGVKRTWRNSQALAGNTARTIDRLRGGIEGLSLFVQSLFKS